MDVMEAVMDHLAVVLMALCMNWLVWLAVLAVPLLVGLWGLRVGGWSDVRRLRAAGVGFAVGAAAGSFALFTIVGGAPDDLRYWVDWSAFALFAAGAGAYVALLAYTAARPTRSPNV